MIQRLSLRPQHIVLNFSEGHKKIAEYFLHLIPLIFISLIVSAHERLLSKTMIGSETLFELFLNVALISPWIAQACCFPLYSEIGKEIFQNGDNNTAKIHFYIIRKFFLFPFVSCLLIGFYSFHFLHHSFLFSLSLFFLCLLQILFAQFMVLPLLQRNFKLWLLGWFSYLLVFYLFNTAWYLAPILGILCIVLVTKSWKDRKNFTITYRNYLLSYLCGLFIGLVLWVDKINLYLSQPEKNISSYIFISLLPSLLGLNYFTIFCLERIRESFKRTIRSVHSEPIKKYVKRRNFTYSLVVKSYFDLTLILFILSIITIVYAKLVYHLNLKLLLFGHAFSLMMTLITVFLNHLLLLRAFKPFIKIMIVIFLTLTLLPFSHDQTPYYYMSFIAFITITYFSLKETKRKWLDTHQVYLSF
jgi:hypothetical protein